MAVLLEGKTVIITGVGGGLGRECVERALREGANVVVAARTQDTLDAVVAELDPEGKRLTAKATDITDAAACEALVAHATERFGSVDALVQVAAFEYVFGGLHETDLDTWRQAFETNVLGAMTILRPVAKAMEAGGGGLDRPHRLAVDVQAGAAPGRLRGVEGRPAHDDVLPGRRAGCRTTSAATWSCRRGCGARRSRCTSACRPTARASAEDAAVEEIVGDFPLRRMTEDGEVADVVMFFASDLAKAVTGQHLMVNSGETDALSAAEEGNDQ